LSYKYTKALAYLNILWGNSYSMPWVRFERIAFYKRWSTTWWNLHWERNCKMLRSFLFTILFQLISVSICFNVKIKSRVYWSSVDEELSHSDGKQVNFYS